jgi:hypothetical protein
LNPSLRALNIFPGKPLARILYVILNAVRLEDVADHPIHGDRHRKMSVTVVKGAQCIIDLAFHQTAGLLTTTLSVSQLADRTI